MKTTHIRRTGALLVTVLALTLAACGAGTLEDTDPAGHQACSSYMTATFDEHEDEFVVVFGSSLVAADHAVESTTPEIRDAATIVSEDPAINTLDADALIAACADHGYEIAEQSAAWWAEQSR